LGSLLSKLGFFFLGIYSKIGLVCFHIILSFGIFSWSWKQRVASLVNLIHWPLISKLLKCNLASQAPVLIWQPFPVVKTPQGAMLSILYSCSLLDYCLVSS
jgi:hypothetical protein